MQSTNGVKDEHKNLISRLWIIYKERVSAVVNLSVSIGQVAGFEPQPNHRLASASYSPDVPSPVYFNLYTLRWKKIIRVMPVSANS
jgi:hypothetical protein